jgi:hypothetical protein
MLLSPTDSLPPALACIECRHLKVALHYLHFPSYCSSETLFPPINDLPVIRLRETIAANKGLAARVENLEHSQQRTSSILEVLVDEIDSLKALPPPRAKRKIGFDL